MPTQISGDFGVSMVQDGVIQTADIANGAVTPEKLSQKMVLGSAQNTTSGTAIDFTGIPSWAKRITVMFSGVSTNGTSLVEIRVGAGSVISTGYISRGGYYQASGVTGTRNTSTGFAVDNFISAGDGRTLMATLTCISGNTWIFSSLGQNDVANGTITHGSGVVTLSGSLDRIRITTVNGTDAFDAGSVNILYEG